MLFFLIVIVVNLTLADSADIQSFFTIWQVKFFGSFSDKLCMKKYRTPTALALFALILLMLLPGYKKQGDAAYFPAPVARPIVAFYANFAASGLYDQGNAARAAMAEILGGVEEICAARGNKADLSNTRAAAESMLNDKVLSGAIKAHEMFFYLRDSETFALLLTGEFSADRIAEFIGKQRANLSSTSLHSNIKSPTGGSERLHLALQNDLLVICPENIAGNIIDNLNNQTSLLDEGFIAFNKMVSARPALAAEVNFAALEKLFGAALLPDWLSQMKHLRLIAASRISKLQLFVPDNAGRASLLKALEPNLPLLNRIAGIVKGTGMAANGKGSSIFIEAPPGLDLEKSLSRKTMAFFLHFFAGNTLHKPILTAASQ